MRPLVAISVGRRLAALVAAEALVVAAVLTIALVAHSRLTGEVSFMSRYVLAPIEAIADSLERSAQVQALLESAPTLEATDRATVARLSDEVTTFLTHYRSEWAVAGSTSDDAKRFREMLRRRNRSDLVDNEASAVSDTARDLNRLRASPVGADSLDATRALRKSLRQLLLVNTDYLDVAIDSFQVESARTRDQIVMVGLAGLVLAVGLAIHVRQAIAPRIRRLVESVRRFQELGVPDRVLEQGRDEIAVLANALDAGFAAIAERDRERDRFLAVVAHELKTPMTSILGFTELALSRPDDTAVRARALELVRRHAGRLRRLIDDVLVAASVRSGKLGFRPQQTDLVALTKKVMGEVELAAPGQRFELESPPAEHLLGDEPLLAQALWNALSYATVINENKHPIGIHLERSGSRVELEVVVDAPMTSQEEIERAFAPFTSFHYEGDATMRNVMGLFLCHEIARVHGGSLGARTASETKRSLVIDLPG